MRTSHMHRNTGRRSVSLAASTGVTLSASKGRGNADGADVQAGNTATLNSGGDTTLKGAVVAANTVQANVGGNLSVESLQDTSTYTSRQSSAGGSISVGGGKVSGGISVGRSNIDSNYQSVNQQSGIQAGDGGFQVNVNNNTDLKGAVIASTQTAIDQNRNTFTTGGTLTTSDIQNSAEYKGEAIAVSASIGPKNTDPKGNTTYLPGVVVGLGSDKGNASSTTTAGISAIAGNTAVRTGDAQTGIEKIFYAAKVQSEIDAQVTITQAFSKEAPKAVATFAANQIKDLQITLAKTQDPATRTQLQAEIDRWKEGGVYRIALHTLSGAFGGGASGALGAAASASAANVMNEFQGSIQQSLEDAGLSQDTAKAFAQGVATLTAAGIGAAVGGGQGAATSVTVDVNNRQLHPDERQWAKDNAAKYRKYLADKTGEVISTEDAYQRLLSAGYAVVDNAAQNAGKSDEFAKQFIASTAPGTLFNATAAERASPFLGGNADGSYTPEQQARWGVKTPAEAASKLVTTAYDYVGRPCNSNCGAKFDAIVNAIKGLEQARLLYQDDPASVNLIDKQIGLLRAGITSDEVTRGAAQSIAGTDKAIAFVLLGNPSRIVAGRGAANTLAASGEVAIPSGFKPFNVEGLPTGLTGVVNTATGEIRVLTRNGKLTDIPATPIPANINASVVPQTTTGIKWGGGIQDQGLPFENYLATKLPTDTRLPPNFKTFDFFDRETGVATSAKTLDTMTAVRVTDPTQVFTALKGNVDTVAGFNEIARLSGRVVDSARITARELQVAIPAGTTPAQWAQINRAVQYGQSQGVTVKITVVK